MKIIALVLIIGGVLALVYQGITYSHKEQELKVGSLEITSENKSTIPLPPIIGALAIAGGVVLLVADSRKGTA